MFVLMKKCPNIRISALLHICLCGCLLSKDYLKGKEGFSPRLCAVFVNAEEKDLYI